MILRALVFATLSVYTIAARADTPAAPVAQLHQALLALPADADCEAQIARITAAVDGSYDLPGIARRMLGTHWSGLRAEQQQAFVERLRQSTVLQYVTRFGRAGGLRFSLDGEQAQAAERVRIDTLLHRPNGTPVKLQYLVQRDDARWRIVNVVAGGVSDAALRRVQYDAVIRREGVEGLLSLLEMQNSELREQACAPRRTAQ